jgi:ribonuclease Y
MEIAIAAGIGLAVAIVIGLILANIIAKRKVEKQSQEAHSKAGLIIKEAEIQAETLKKDKLLEAKEKFLKMRQEFEEEANRKKNQIIANEQKIKQRESQLSKEIETIKRKESEIEEERQSLLAQHELVKK